MVDQITLPCSAQEMQFCEKMREVITLIMRRLAEISTQHQGDDVMVAFKEMGASVSRSIFHAHYAAGRPITVQESNRQAKIIVEEAVEMARRLMDVGVFMEVVRAAE